MEIPDGLEMTNTIAKQKLEKEFVIAIHKFMLSYPILQGNKISTCYIFVLVGKAGNAR